MTEPTEGISIKGLRDAGLQLDPVAGAVIVNGSDSDGNRWVDCYFRTEYPAWWRFWRRYQIARDMRLWERRIAPMLAEQRRQQEESR